MRTSIIISQVALKLEDQKARIYLMMEDFKKNNFHYLQQDLEEILNVLIESIRILKNESYELLNANDKDQHDPRQGS